jgi:tetratricopeptide (TPR) repeat protein
MNLFRLIYADDVVSLIALVAILGIVGSNMADVHIRIWGWRSAGIAYVIFVVYACANVSPTGASDLAYIAFRGLFAAGLTVGPVWMALAIALLCIGEMKKVEKRVATLSPVKETTSDANREAAIDVDAPTDWKPKVRDFSKLPADVHREFENRNNQIRNFETEAHNLLERLRKPLKPASPLPGVVERRRFETQIRELELAREFYSDSGETPDKTGKMIAECTNRIAELKRVIGTIPPEKETPPHLAGIAVFDEAIARRPKNPVLYAKRASELISQRLYQKAIADCNRALQLFPGYYYAFVIRGLANHHIRKYSTAVRDLERAIYENPSYGYAYASLAATYNATGAYREALGPAYYASRSTFAGDHQLAIAYEHLYDNENAVRTLTKVIEGDPDATQVPDARLRRAKQLLKLGRTELAMHDLKTHLAQRPDPAAKKLLAQLENLPNFQPEAADQTSQEETDDERAAAQLGLLEAQTIFVNR